MSAALRLANRHVFQKVNDALPQLVETGRASNLTDHDLRHAALVMRILELELNTKSALTNTNLLNLIISDRFLDSPMAVSASPPMEEAPRPESSRAQGRCDALNPLCAYAESVSVRWAVAKIAHTYRSRHLLCALKEIMRLRKLPVLAPHAFNGLPFFETTIGHRPSRELKATPVREVIQDYLIMYRNSMLLHYNKTHPEDAWDKAAYAVLLASVTGLSVGQLLRELGVHLLDDVDESPRIDEFIAKARRSSHATAALAVAAAHPTKVDVGEYSKNHVLISSPVSHVGIYNLGSPSSETTPL